MRPAAALPLLLLAACHPARDDPRAVTPDEQAQLNDAAATLDANNADANDTDASPLDNDEDNS